MIHIIKIEGYRRSGRTTLLNRIFTTSAGKPIIVAPTHMHAKYVHGGSTNFSDDFIVMTPSFPKKGGYSSSLILIDEPNYLSDDMIDYLAPMIEPDAHIYYTIHPKAKLSPKWKKFLKGVDPEKALFKQLGIK